MKPFAFLLFRKIILLLLIPVTGGLLFFSCVTPEGSLADKKAYTEDDNAYRKKFDVTFDAEEKPIRYGYYYIVSTVPEGYRVRVFHPDKKTLTEQKTYSTPNLTLLHGPYKSFWDDGSIHSMGLYEYGRKQGMWVESEPGRGKSSSGMYLNQRKEGQWIQLDTNGLIESMYTWHDDQLHGKFFKYDSNAQKINEGIYRADTLIAELFKQPLTSRPYLKSCLDNVSGDVYLCSDATLTTNIYTNLKYPAKAREMKIVGTALVQWDVLPDGSAANIRVPQGLCDEIEHECLRVFKLNEKWVPAYREGKPVKYTLTLPITFRL